MKLRNNHEVETSLAPSVVLIEKSNSNEGTPTTSRNWLYSLLQSSGQFHTLATQPFKKNLSKQRSANSSLPAINSTLKPSALLPSIVNERNATTKLNDANDFLTTNHFHTNNRQRRLPTNEPTPARIVEVPISVHSGLLSCLRSMKGGYVVWIRNEKNDGIARHKLPQKIDDRKWMWPEALTFHCDNTRL